MMVDDAALMPSCRSSDREEHSEMLVDIGPRLLKALLGTNACVMHDTKQ